MGTNSNKKPNYNDYYKAQLEAGKEYQDFVIDVCWNVLGLAIVQYTSKMYQQHVGESRTGAEIKFNRKYGQTGNLWIELEEKAEPRPGPYAISGINREDNTWLFITGDYDHIYLFGKRHLQALSKQRPHVENDTKTSVGFLLRASEAEEYALAILRPNAAEKVAKFQKDPAKLGQLGAELYNLLKKDSRQCSLFDNTDRARDLIEELRSRSVTVWREGNQIMMRANPGIITDADRINVNAVKPEMLSLLEERSTQSKIA